MRIYLDSDNILEVLDLRDRRTGEPIVGAEVTAELYVSSDLTAPLATVTCADEGDGVYLGTLPQSVTSALDAGTPYTLEVVSVAAGRTVTKRIDVRPVFAGAND